MSEHPKPLTVREVIAQLQALVERSPERADYPVHILNMEADDAQEHPRSGLVTLIELDYYDAEQGDVVDLVADPWGTLA